MTDAPIHLPVINLNGDMPEQIFSDHQKVLDAARTLRAHLAGTAPHGRNWQTAPDHWPETPGAGYRAARDRWALQCEQVEILIKETMEVMIHVKDSPRFDMEKFKAMQAESAGPFPIETLTVD